MYTSSPVEQPATQILTDGYVRKSGTTSSLMQRARSGSRKKLVTLTPTMPRKRCMQAGSCSTRSWYAEIVEDPAAVMAARMLRRSGPIA